MAFLVELMDGKVYLRVYEPYDEPALVRQLLMKPWQFGLAFVVSFFGVSLTVVSRRRRYSFGIKTPRFRAWVLRTRADRAPCRKWEIGRV